MLLPPAVSLSSNQEPKHDDDDERRNACKTQHSPPSMMMMHDATPAKRNTLTSQRCVPGLALLPVLGHRSVQECLKRMEGKLLSPPITIIIIASMIMKR